MALQKHSRTVLERVRVLRLLLVERLLGLIEQPEASIAITAWSVVTKASGEYSLPSGYSSVSACKSRIWMVAGRGRRVRLKLHALWAAMASQDFGESGGESTRGERPRGAHHRPPA